MNGAALELQALGLQSRCTGQGSKGKAVMQQQGRGNQAGLLS